MLGINCIKLIKIITKLQVYSSIEHGNVIEQQMPVIRVQHQIGYTSTVMTLNSHFWYTLYIVCSLCSIA